MSVKKNILTIFCFILLLSGAVKAMDPDRETRFIKHKPRAERTSDLRLSVIREEKQLPREDWELLRLQKDLAAAQRQVDSAKEEFDVAKEGFNVAKNTLRLKREARNMLHERVRALEKEKAEALKATETKSPKKKKKIKARHADDRSQK